MSKKRYRVRLQGDSWRTVEAEHMDQAVAKAVVQAFPDSTVEEILFNDEKVSYRGRRLDENGKIWHFQCLDVHLG